MGQQEQWGAVDRYFEGMLVGADPVMEGVLAASAAAGLPSIQVTAGQGKMLYLLARIMGARRILEIGTLGGYSTIWLARALPAGGVVVTLEVDERYAEVARGNVERAGLSEVVEVITGRAVETLGQLAAEGRGPFDLIFIDADKQSNPEYFGWAMKLSRPGSVIVVDNVVREGRVIEEGSEDASVRGVRRCMELMAAEPRFSATAMQTVGGKGWDGFVVGVVK